MKSAILILIAGLGLVTPSTIGQNLSIETPTAPFTFDDFTTNDPLQWNDAAMYNPLGLTGTWSPVYLTDNLPEGAVALWARATGGCPAAEIHFKYTLSLDLDGNGAPETVIDSDVPTLGFGLNEDEFDGAFRIARVTRDVETDDPDHSKLASFDLPYGTHKIKWTATGCAEVSVVEQVIIVRDGKKPMVACINGLAINQFNLPAGASVPQVTLWATDFVSYAEDNATDASQIVFALRDADINPGTGFPLDGNAQAQASLTWNCSEAGTNVVELWARDKAGKADFCTTYLILSDNQGACATGDPGPPMVCFTVASNCPNFEGANVQINDPMSGVPNPPISSSPLVFSGGCAGLTGFWGLPISNTYVVTPTKDVDPLNGVSTFDLIRISKHVLNVQPFTTGYEFIAADVNNNKAVTTFDIVELRKLILGIYSDFQQNDSWRFVDKAFNFNMNSSTPPLQQPWPGSIQVSQLFGTVLNFQAVKIGDLTGDAICSNFSTVKIEDRSPARFSIEDRPLRAGEEVSIPIFLEEESALLGWQMAMRFNPDFIDIKETLPESSGGPAAVPMVARTAPGRVAMNWFSASPHNFLAGRDALISLKIKVLTDCRLSDVLFLENNGLRPEAYFDDEASHPIELFFSKNKSAATSSGLTARPNPFIEKTTLEWWQAQPGEAVVEVFDATGRLVFHQKTWAGKAGNQLAVGGFGEGLFFVRVQAGGESFSTTILQKN